MGENLDPIGNKVIIFNSDHESRGRIILTKGKPYRVIVHDRDTGNGYIVENREEGSIDTFNVVTRGHLLTMGLINKETRITFAYMESKDIMKEYNQFGCKSLCVGCSGKCGLWEGE
jgi:hypothetical protein